MQTSGVDAAIQELEREVKRVEEAIATLRKIQEQATCCTELTGGTK